MLIISFLLCFLLDISRNLLLAHFLHLIKKCSPNGCWYCSDLCQHCMQPSPTLYSGVHENGMLLKFCSEECKKFWFPDPDQQPHYVACYLDEICQAKETAALLMTVVNQKKKWCGTSLPFYWYKL